MALNAAGLKELQTRYEMLRQNHLDGVFSIAMSVFLREGMCGWIRVWKNHNPEVGSKRTSDKDPSKKKINDETGNDMGEFVELIASMTLQKLKGA